MFCYEKSFKSYTGKTTNGKLKVECWDAIKNEGVNPIDVSYANNKKYWFQCDVCPHSFNSAISNITQINDNWCPYCSVPCQKLCGEDDCIICYDKSFKSYPEKTTNGKLKVECWDAIKNGDIKPIDIAIKTHKKYWFKCDVCLHSFNSEISSITGLKCWCPYCSGRNICGEDDCDFCYEKSFKSYTGTTKNGKLKVECWHPTDNGNVNPIDVSYANNKKYWFKCDVCPHSFESRINCITGRDHWCPYCANTKRCDEDGCDFCYNNSFASYTGTTKNGKLKVECWHPTKNGDVNPRDVSYGNDTKYWFQCDNDKCKNCDFNSAIYHITRSNGTWCPVCASSKGEKLLTKIIKELIKLIKEFGYPEDLEKRYTGCRDKNELPFDRCILIDGFPDVLFEYDGIQHFEPTAFGGKNANIVENFILCKKHDIIKNKYCVDNNKVLVRIDHTMDLNIEAPIKQLMEDGIKMSMENKSGIIFSNPELYQECYGDEYII
jgi:hypothetical protein